MQKPPNEINFAKKKHEGKKRTHSLASLVALPCIGRRHSAASEARARCSGGACHGRYQVFRRRNDRRAGTGDRAADFYRACTRIDPGFVCSPQVLNLILESRDAARRREIADTARGSALSPEFRRLKLSSGAAETVLDAFIAGRAVFTGETPAGIPAEALALTEFFHRLNMAESVLIICPTALKIQWQREIAATSQSKCVIVEGDHNRRRQLYKAPAYYHIVSYHSLASDAAALGSSTTFDVVICDHAERIAGWNQQIASGLRRLRCDYFYAFCSQNNADTLPCPAPRRVLTLDNDADSAQHGEIMLTLPMTRLQRRLHDEYHAAASSIAAKWNKSGFLTEKSENGC